MMPGMKRRIFLTRALPSEVMKALGEQFDLHANRYDRPLSKAGLLRGVRRTEGLIAMLSDPIDREVIKAAPHLKIIANYAVGYNNIDLKAATDRGIVVTNTPGVLTETTADLTFGLILAVARRLPEAEQALRSGRWTGWAPTQFLGSDIYGKTLGLIGMGRIGKAVARRAAGFSMRVVYHCRHRLPASDEKGLQAKYLPLARLLKASDFVSLHLPLTEVSYHLIDQAALRKMRPTAFLINTARGPIIDEKALIRALEQKTIRGCGLDVFEEEPSVPARLRKMKQVVLLPHIGSASRETRIRMGRIVLENISDFFTGENPKNMIKLPK